MTDHPIEQAATNAQILQSLQDKFGNAVAQDTREGFTGVIVDSNKLVDVATYLRDEQGYDYLSSATAVDYHTWGDHMEMVYHLYNIRAGVEGPTEAFVLKAQTDRENATLPSLISVWPGADFQEREAWDLHGIYFEGHPNLK